jgi:hypothetical protein
MTDWVRIHNADAGKDITVSAALAEISGVKPLDKPATDRFGAPLPAKDHGPMKTNVEAKRTAKPAPKATTAKSTSEANKEAK